MRRADIVPNTSFDCGTVISSAGFNPKHKQLCKFSCIRCGTVKVAIYAEVVSGRVRSCKCLKDELVRAHYVSLLAEIPLVTRKIVFTTARYRGRKAAGLERKFDKTLVGYIIRAEWHRLSGYDFESAGHVFDAAQNSMQEAMAVFEMTPVEVEAVCFIFQRARREAEDLQLEAWNSMGPNEQVEAGELVQSVRDDIEYAIEIAGDDDTNMNAIDRSTGEVHDYLKGRYRGEFTANEFATNPKTRSIYGKVYQALMLVPAPVREVCFGVAAETFIKICKYSVLSRRSRRSSKLKRGMLNLTSLSSKTTTTRGDTTPAFSYSTSRAGELFSLYAQARSQDTCSG